MCIVNSKGINHDVDQDAISKLLSKYINEMQSHGVRNHVWILFALNDIAEYCSENGLEKTSHLIDSIIQRVDEEVVRSAISDAAIH